MEPRKGLQSITTKYVSRDEPSPDYLLASYKGATVLDDPTHPIIWLRSRNTNTHIHELYHAVYSPQKSSSTLDTSVQEEVNAELLTCQCKDKGIRMNSLKRIGFAAMDQGARPNETMTAIVNALGGQGIVLDRSLRSNLWQGLMQKKKKMRGR